jgi:hypothetical protein
MIGKILVKANMPVLNAKQSWGVQQIISALIIVLVAVVERELQ